MPSSGWRLVFGVSSMLELRRCPRYGCCVNDESADDPLSLLLSVESEPVVHSPWQYVTLALGGLITLAVLATLLIVVMPPVLNAIAGFLSAVWRLIAAGGVPM